MLSTLREIRDFFIASVTKVQFWGVFGTMIVLFALIGPFGTFDRIGLPMRFLYWSVTMLGSWLIAMAVIAIILGSLLKRFDRPLLLMIVATAIAALPITVFIQWTIPLFFGGGARIGFWEQFAYTLPISVLFGLIVNFAVGHNMRMQLPAADPLDNALMKRLPIGLRGPVKHMSMQDHYIEVNTTKGRELVLMRMADAVSALSSDDGLQVHRSHWVNKSYIETVRRENGQPVLIMEDGAEYPVSRSYVKAAREAGLI